VPPQTSSVTNAGSSPPSSVDEQSQLLQTRAAFDSVAVDYDGDRGNNAAIQDMRQEMWRWLDQIFPPASRLIDLGCGTGLDAIRMAQLGHSVTATDWSAEMVRRTGDRAQHERLTDRVRSIHIGAHQLQQLGDQGCYDGAYSNLGALNCVPDLADLSHQCARLLKPGGKLVFAVIGRLCPWEAAYYLLQRRWARVKVRYRHGSVPVNMNRHTIWTRYYTPREFYRAFETQFQLAHYRGLCVFVPPPYLLSFRTRHPRWHERLWRLDRCVAGWPLLRSIGDHFLIVMRKRAR
jgi:ubiquinone/menaquinone biosynthesis C-methylase UbiE